MNILVINPGGRVLNYCFYSMKYGLDAYPGTGGCPNNNSGPAVMRRIKEELAGKKSAAGDGPGIIAIRVSCGGNTFTGPAIMNGKTLAGLRRLIPQAPFHIPMILDLAAGAKEVFPGAEIVFVFETAFFTGLPARERFYAVAPEITRGAQVQRMGFHGILHEAACRQAAGRIYRDGFAPPAKILSICLEPRPEAAAVMGLRPVIATGGTTPLEGLPGDTSCGDLDIGIIIKLGHELKWGPEQINNILTGESGISGMLKRRTNLDEIFASDGRDCRLVREFIMYKLLQVCGAAAAAMGALDCIVFSGRYCRAGKVIGPWLMSKLSFMERKSSEPRLSWEIMEQPVEKIIAETAEVFVIENMSRVVSAE